MDTNMSLSQLLLKSRHEIIVASLLMIVVAFVYFQVINHGFISFDDPDYVTENYKVQKGLTLESVKSVFEFSRKGDRTYWHPLTYLSHMFDYQIFYLVPYASNFQRRKDDA